MDTLLIFFALPIAVIIISAILQKLLKSPIAVAALIFAIFLVVTFSIGNTTLLIATLAYTILAFITAVIVKFICEFNNGFINSNNIFSASNNISTNTISTNSINTNTIRSNTINTNDINTNSINTVPNNSNNSCSCRCNRFRRF